MQADMLKDAHYDAWVGNGANQLAARRHNEGTCLNRKANTRFSWEIRLTRLTPTKHELT